MTKYVTMKKAPAPADRAKAYRLRAKRRRGETLTGDDSSWLDGYERERDIGASASERIVHVEERAASVGTGEAAQVAAAAAMAREEGRRIDYLTKTGIEALQAACRMYEGICKALNERTQTLEEVHLGMLEAVRTQYLARTQAEVDALQSQQENLADHLGSALLERVFPTQPNAKALPKKQGG